MTTTTEALKDWISYGYDQQSKYLFVIKAVDAPELKPYFVKQNENVDLIRTSILAGGEKIVEELNMEVKLLLLNTVK